MQCGEVRCEGRCARGGTCQCVFVCRIGCSSSFQIPCSHHVQQRARHRARHCAHRRARSARRINVPLSVATHDHFGSRPFVLIPKAFPGLYACHTFNVKSSDTEQSLSPVPSKAHFQTVDVCPAPKTAYGTTWVRGVIGTERGWAINACVPACMFAQSVQFLTECAISVYALP